MSKIKPNLRERAMYVVAPEKGEAMYRKRAAAIREAQRGEQKRDGPQMASATGYGNHGASQTLNSMIGWIVNGSGAEDDIDLHGALLRRRARDLYAGGGLGRSGPATMVTNVVGWGVHPKPKINGELLGMTDEECDAWERKTLAEFQLWAKSKMCDASRQQNFYSMQQLAYRSQLISGDVFALFVMKPNQKTPYQTTIRLLEADRVSTPESDGSESTSKDLENGGRIIDGVEIDKTGAVVRYHIASRHPLSESDASDLVWTAVDAYGKATGEPNILHVMAQERPEQRRGIPFVASQIERIKQLDRYLGAELAANVVSAMLSIFLESVDDDGQLGLDDAVSEEEKVTDDDLKLELAPGVIINLPPGKKVKEVNPIRNNTAFESFVSVEETLIGTGMSIPKEVLIKKYESNYTAARGAMLDFWREVRVNRTAFNDQFNRPIYEQWLSEAIALGRIDAPGFFDDPIIRDAWCGCQWMGASMGHVDPLKEVNAAEKRIQNNISTQEQEASEYNGNDWSANVRQRKKEIAAFGDSGNAENRTQRDKEGGTANGGKTAV